MMPRSALALLMLQVMTVACAVEVDEAPLAAPGPAELVPAPVVPLMGELGTRHAVVFVDAAPTGHWVAICQGRVDTDGDDVVFVQLGSHGETHGDELRSFLIREPGEGEPIDEFVDSDRSGRYVAVVRSGRLVVLDTWDGGETILGGAEVEDDPNPFGPHRAVAFDDAGTRVGYARRVAAGHEIVVRELETGSERVIDLGSALLWRFHLDPSGAFVFVRAVDRDSNGDGVVGLPSAATSLGARRCRGPVSSYGAYGWEGDEPILKVAPVIDGASVRSEPGALGVLQGRLVVRRADEAIVVREAGSERELVPATCAGRIRHVDEVRGQVIAACKTAAGPALWRFGGGAAQDLGVTVWPDEDDHWWTGGGTIRSFDGKLYNIDTGTIGRVIGVGDAYQAGGDKILYTDNEETYIHELDTDRKRPLPFRLPYSYETREQGSIIAVFNEGRTYVAEPAAERLLGVVTGRPLAVTGAGEVLVAGYEIEGQLAVGPLRWVRPQ